MAATAGKRKAYRVTIEQSPRPNYQGGYDVRFTVNYPEVRKYSYVDEQRVHQMIAAAENSADLRIVPQVQDGHIWIEIIRISILMA